MILVAQPADTHTVTLECDECGPLGVYERVVVHLAAHHHLHEHGVQTPNMTMCDCGYSTDTPTGHPNDIARCIDCAWTATGLMADHDAHHHHLDTRHTWQLDMGR